MLFNSAIFGLFIAVLLPLYALVRHSASRKWLLLVASYLFYANWDYRYLSLLLLSTVVDYCVGKTLFREQRTGRRRLLLLVSLVTNLGLLATFKYGNFLLGNLTPLWEAFDVSVWTLPGNIPVGISFYTFQTLSYTIDIYRRREEPARSPLEFALFVAFFGQLVAGPILRSREFLPQVATMRDLRMERIAEGTQRFLLGLFKKVVIADNVGLLVDAVFGAPENYGSVTLWLAAYGFALQIYCDFSGYTDMALGIGTALGLKFPENFHAPYLSRSITEFWRRWHMSLSRWLRDYLYIPLGGSHGSKGRTYVNLMLTMLLGGLWHGAAWTFVLWGGFHGLLLALERMTGYGRDPDAQTGGFAGLVRRMATFHLVCLAWVMFRADGFSSLRTYLTRMFTEWTQVDDGWALGFFWSAVLFLLVFGQHLAISRQLRIRVWDRLPAPAQGFGLALLVVAVTLFHVDDIAFIYFQF